MSNHPDDDEFAESTSSNLELKFNKAADYIQKVHSTLSSSILLEIYGLYKQATTGECNQSKPSIFNAQGRAKWNAWNSLGKLEKSKAMELYIEKVTENGWKPEIENFDKSQQWVCNSMPVVEDLEVIPEHRKTIFDFVKEGNLDKLKKILNLNHINQLDDEGMGLIHWATDRNSIDILKFLLNSGANCDLKDQDQQTALHYASSCGHMDCATLLLKFGANRDLLDEEGQNCVDVAFDNKMKELLVSSKKNC